MRNGKVDVQAADTVLDDKPVDDVDVPPAAPPPAALSTRGEKPVTEPLGQAGASFGQARTIEMVFRAKLRRLEFDTRQGKLVEAAVVKERWAATGPQCPQWRAIDACGAGVAN